MRIIPTRVADLFVVDIEPINDARGFFARAWSIDEFAAAGLAVSWAQANVARSSRKGTLRGLHFQRPPHDEHKLVRCTLGSVFDVAVDLRRDSSTYRSWVAFELSADNHRMVLIPPGCAHGYLTLEDDAELFYMTSMPYAREAATGVRFDDPAFEIAWPGSVVVVSDQDLTWPRWPVHEGESLDSR